MAPERGSSTSSEDSATSSKKIRPGVPVACNIVEKSLPLSLYNLDLNDNFCCDLSTGATEQSIRPWVVRSEDTHKQLVASLSGDETCSTLHVLRPRAVLSSPGESTWWSNELTTQNTVVSMLEILRRGSL